MLDIVTPPCFARDILLRSAGALIIFTLMPFVSMLSSMSYDDLRATPSHCERADMPLMSVR